MRKQTKLWTTKDGRKVRICDMEDDHLINTVRMLQRNGEARRINNSVYYATCMGPNGEMAQLAFEQECDQMWDATFESYVPRIYYNLVDEAERRRLTIPTQLQRVDIDARVILEKATK